MVKNPGFFSEARAFITLLMLFSLQAHTADIKPQVLATIKPLALIVESLAGDLVDTEVLLASGDSPHHLSLRVSQVEKLKLAELIVWLGPDMERYLEKPLAQTSSHISLASIVPVDADAHEHSHGEQHLWLSLENVSLLAESVSEFLTTMLPHQEEELKTRLQKFQQELASLERDTRIQLKPLTGGFLAYHSFLESYVSAYKLNQLGTVLEGSDHSPSVRRIARLKKNEARTAKCLVADIQEEEAAKRYAEILKLPLQVVDILGANIGGGNWFDYYDGFTKAIQTCLN